MSIRVTRSSEVKQQHLINTV